MERTLALYPRYVFSVSLMGWIPVNVLYFSGLISLTAALWLEAIYYATVVLLEVPSGYLADLLGRRLALLLGAAAGVAANGLFILAGTPSLALVEPFLGLALGQVLLAVQIAFASGSDAALHYEAARACGREDDFGELEARASANQPLGIGLSAALAGIACFALDDLRPAYLISLLGQLLALAIVLRMHEPAAAEGEARPFLRQLIGCLRQLARPLVCWGAAAWVLVTIVNHLPYTAYQPYLAQLLGQQQLALRLQPVATGSALLLAMLLASAIGRHAARIGAALGAARTVALALGLQLLICLALGSAVHWAIALTLLLRGVPGAIHRPLLRALLAPAFEDGQRATALSLLSLAGRFAFSATLATGAIGLAGGGWTQLAPLLVRCAWVGGGLTLLLAALAPAAARLPEGRP